MRKHWSGPKPCRACGGPKPKGRGVLYCDTCRPVRAKRINGAWQRGPCLKCGGPKPPGVGRTLCDECYELARWYVERKEAARLTTVRKPCQDCGGRKPPGEGRLYCDACRDKRTWRNCMECGEPKIARGERKWLCDECRDSPERRERHREYDRERKRLERLVPEKAKRTRQLEREARARMRATVQGRERLNEAARIGYRIRKLRNGHELAAVESAPKAVKVPGRVTIPGRPLVAAIDRIAANVDPAEQTSAQDGYSIVVDRAGENPREVSGWRTGERNAGLDTADRVLLKLDLCWWEVWNEDTVRKPILEARSYRFPLRTRRNGERKPTRHLQHTTLYGDLGPDFDELGRVERLMTGQPYQQRDRQLEAAA